MASSRITLNADVIWRCINIDCGAENTLGPCPNCGNQTYIYEVRLYKTGETSFAEIPEIECTHCSMIYSRELKCPQCGSWTPIKKAGLPPISVSRPLCFIATVAYGSPYAREVEILREFRDTHLQPYTLGRIVIRLYELLSPSVANWIASKPLARQLVRQAVVSPLLRIARKMPPKD